MTKEQNQNEIINQAAELLELMDKLINKISLYLHKLNMKRRQLYFDCDVQNIYASE
jgi:hypothetical protein